MTGASGGGPDTLMWEVRAARDRLAELLAWVRGLPAPDGGSAEVYTAADDRVVVILHTPGTTPPRLPEPPAELLSRPPHQWPFTRHGTLGPDVSQPG
ncbi:hypothetical protein [Streptacidiphilus cavernicola]|uniref:Aminoglycoside phosphotransferase family protein n=1 Tax=Streptacidiphilus cavernicola TaxID=3342716 RepID=A0ABV6W0W6_9ACTN